MEIGDIVVRKSYGKDVTFKIIDIKKNGSEVVYVLKGINIRIVADSLEQDLEVVRKESFTSEEEVFNKRVNESIKKVLITREESNKIENIRGFRIEKKSLNSDMSFGRPGKILHIDGDAEYLENCLKVYKRLSLDVVGKMIPEVEQPSKVLQLVKENKPDIVVITGHDAISKNTKDFMNINNYRNSKYYIATVTELRNYRADYDDLVIFAGACQSYYEAILDAGANFASSPNRVLIHCLDPVFLCEKIAYTSIQKVVSIQDGIQNTITGTKGIGGLETRGKYRAGFPKSSYA